MEKNSKKWTPSHCRRLKYNSNADKIQAQVSLFLSAINLTWLIFVCNFNYPCQALVPWVMCVKNVILHVFTYFCHRNLSFHLQTCKMHQSDILKLFGNVRDWGFPWGEVFRYFKIPLLQDAKSTLQSEYFAVVSTTAVMTSKMRQYLALREVWENWSPAILIAGKKMKFHQFTGRKFSLCLCLCIYTDHRRQQSCLLLWRTLEDTV